MEAIEALIKEKFGNLNRLAIEAGRSRAALDYMLKNESRHKDLLAIIQNTPPQPLPEISQLQKLYKERFNCSSIRLQQAAKAVGVEITRQNINAFFCRDTKGKAPRYGKRYKVIFELLTKKQ